MWVDDQWLCGICNGAHGSFPASFVDHIPDDLVRLGQGMDINDFSKMLTNNVDEKVRHISISYIR